MKSNSNVRKYNKDLVISFRKTKENYGGLSNMAAGYPIVINNIEIYSSEALYQACRYPHLPDVQREILTQKSPMTAKMKSKKYRPDTRNDWELVKIQIMRWTLRVKLLQNWGKFSSLLHSTGDKDIVEYSTKDQYWGAIPYDKNLLVGMNALGRLLMELREEMIIYSRENECLLNPPKLENFKLLAKDIPVIKAQITEIKSTKSISNLEYNNTNLFDFE